MKILFFSLTLFYFSSNCFSQIIKKEFSNVKIDFKELLYYQFVFFDENKSFIIGKSKIIEFSDEVKVLNVNPNMGYKTQSEEVIDNSIDTLNLRFYNIQKDLFNRKVYLNYWDFNDPILSKSIEFKASDSFNSKCFLISNDGKLTVICDNNKEINIYEINFQSESFRLVSTIEKGNNSMEIIKDNCGSLFCIKTTKTNLENELVFQSYSAKDYSFNEIDSLSFEINESINLDKDISTTKRKIVVNPSDKSKWVICYSQLTNEVKNNKISNDRNREYFIYECDLIKKSVNEKIITDKSLTTNVEISLEIIFQNKNTFYLEETVVNKIEDKKDVPYRLQYVFNEDTENPELKFLQIPNIGNIHLYLLNDFNDKVENQKIDECNVSYTNDLQYRPQMRDFYHYKHFYNSQNKYINFEFCMQGGKKGFFGYYFVYKKDLNN